MKPLLLTLLTIPSLALAQEAQKHLRLIPLGQISAWKEKLDPITGVRIGDEPPPGSHHPKIMTASDGKEAGQSVNPTLGTFSKNLNFGPKVGKLDLYDGKELAGKPWLTAPLPAFPVSLGVLFRDPAQMTWLTPRILFFDDTQEAFPDGTIRFVNVLDHKVIVRIGAKPEVLDPGKALIKPLKVGDNRVLLGYFDKNGAVVTLFDNDLRLGEGQRVQAFIYKNQSKKADAKPLFLWKPEPMPAL